LLRGSRYASSADNDYLLKGFRRSGSQITDVLLPQGNPFRLRTRRTLTRSESSDKRNRCNDGVAQAEEISAVESVFLNLLQEWPSLLEINVECSLIITPRFPSNFMALVE
jgi:hypothetical protein